MPSVETQAWPSYHWAPHAFLAPCRNPDFWACAFLLPQTGRVHLPSPLRVRAVGVREPQESGQGPSPAFLEKGQVCPFCGCVRGTILKHPSGDRQPLAILGEGMETGREARAVRQRRGSGGAWRPRATINPASGPTEAPRTNPPFAPSVLPRVRLTSLAFHGVSGGALWLPPLAVPILAVN